MRRADQPVGPASPALSQAPVTITVLLAAATAALLLAHVAVLTTHSVTGP